jgi:surface protein
MFYKCKSFDADLSKWNVKNAKKWNNFAIDSLLAEFPEKIPAKFR